MTVDDEFEVNGRWWSPERPERRVPGTLRFSPRTGGELTLIGSLRESREYGEADTDGETTTVVFTEDSMDRAGRHDRVLGVAEGRAFTIEGGIVTRTQNLLSADTNETLHAPLVFSSVHFSEGEPAVGTAVTLRLHHLEDWIGETGIRETTRFRDDANPPPDVEPRFVLESYDIPERSTGLDDGAAVTLGHTLGATGNRLDRRALTQWFYFKVDYGRLISTDDLLEVAGDLQDLVSIGTQRTCNLIAVRCSHPDLDRTIDDRAVSGSFGLHAHWNIEPERPGQKRPHQSAMWFTFAQLGGIDAVGRWMQTARSFRGELARAMASHYSRGMYVADRLLNCTAALEGFDRQTSGRERDNLKHRLLRCADIAGSPFSALVRDIPAWAELVRQERNQAAHQLQHRVQRSSQNTYVLWRSLYTLFVLCLLRDAAVDDATYEQIEQHQELHRLRRELDTILTSPLSADIESGST